MTLKPKNKELLVVATPIGNLGDASDRMKEVLASVGVVFAEDARVTGTLLKKFAIETRIVSVHQHTDVKKIEELLHDVEESVAYVSDAGTPGISDPGGAVVAAAVTAGFTVTPVPGPSALTAALSIAGFKTDRFRFFGFPPSKKGRKSFFESITATEEAVALYESKHRVLKTLEQLPQDRPMVLCRELTKLHETVYRGTARAILEQINTTSQKGEFVLVLAPTNWK